MNCSHPSRVALVAVIAAVTVACQPSGDQEPAEPHIAGGTDIDRGRYLVIVGGCNDCHTDGYMVAEGDVPEDQWLLGSALGWRGPWGTTYPPNLRLTVQRMGEDEWVEMLRTRTALPPMPWMNLNQVAETDSRALYRYISSLGAFGEPAPTALPPGQEPSTPYFVLDPVMPGQ
ncbi:MAG: cytochrome C [Gemmatimonadota bacterium]|nr:cytochrome C [Gemmatimonadota bacterium]